MRRTIPLLARRARTRRVLERERQTTPARSLDAAGVLRVGVIGPQGEPAIERLQSLDPAQARSFAESLAADQLFESLTSYDAGR